MKIGLLTHLSPTYPLLASDFLVSLRLPFGKNVELEKVFLSANASEKEVLEEAQKLLLDEVDYLISYTNVTNLTLLQDLVAKFGKTSILIDSGAQSRIVGSENAKQAYWLSMQLMESAYRLCQYTSEEGKGKLVILSDFINSGYQMASHFTNCFDKNGGEVCFQFVAPMQDDLENQLDELAKRIIEEAATHVYINAHGEEGSKYLTLSKRNDIRNKLPKLKWCIGNQLFHEVNASDLKENEEIYVCSTWLKNSESGKSFSKMFEEKTNRKPSIFSSLGYEAGLLVKSIEDKDIVNIEGLRGKLVWSDKQNYLQAQHNFYAIRKGEVTLISQHLDDPKIKDLESAMLSGWTNAYLCY